MKTTYKFTVLLVVALAFGFNARAQKLYNINLRVFNDKATIKSIQLICDSMIVHIDADGNIKLNTVNRGDFEYWGGTDGAHRDGKLKLSGNTRLDYYDNFGWDNIGKLKSINDIGITYYDRFSSFDNIGRVKSIGNITFSYNEKFDGADNLGKLKSIGDIKITYYDRYGNMDNIGKLKSIGNTMITYFDRFDAKENYGKIKSIKGNTPFLNIVKG